MTSLNHIVKSKSNKIEDLSERQIFLDQLLREASQTEAEHGLLLLIAMNEQATEKVLNKANSKDRKESRTK